MTGPDSEELLRQTYDRLLADKARRVVYRDMEADLVRGQLRDRRVRLLRHVPAQAGGHRELRPPLAQG